MALFMVTCGFAQEKVTYSGTFGDTGHIEMEISTNNQKDYYGRYRFENTKKWILLKGAMYFDRRNQIPQNLVLHEFGSDNDTAVFDLYMQGNKLTGTWQQKPHLPISEVKLEIGELKKNNAFDGFYRQDANELTVKTVSENSIEVSVWIKDGKNCPEIKLKGRLIKVGEEWKGSMVDAAERGEVAITVSFGMDSAKLEMVPAFSPAIKCEISTAPYVRQPVREGMD